MERIEAVKKPVEIKALIKKTACESDCSQLITEPCVVYENGKPIIIYDIYRGDMKALEWAVKNTNFHTGIRTRGLKTTSRIFGFRPRNPLRHNFCSKTSYAYEQPKQNEIVTGFAKTLSEFYRERFPEHYESQIGILNEVLPEWTILGTPFTSGIINKNNPLKYHFDHGNFKGVKSCMIVLRKGIDGGNLNMPEYGLKFALPYGSVILFDGQEILHGVTPIRKISQDSFRYSLVYYSLRMMKNCLSFDEEVKFARKDRLRREEMKL